MARLLLYTRKPIDNVYYDPRLAFSLHLALSGDGIHYTALNHNSGVCFPKATENPDGSLNPKCIKDIRITGTGRAYIITAIRTDGEGDNDYESIGKTISFETTDFVEYRELGLNDISEEYKALVSTVPSTDGTDIENIEGVVPQCITDISDETAEYLEKVLTTPYNTGVVIPDYIKVSSDAELANFKVKFVYSDGSCAEKPVLLDTSAVNFDTPGEYKVKGRVKQPHFDFPLLLDRADPCIGKWNGKYYFIATNDADNNHTLFMRESDTIEGLISAEEHLILDSSTYPEIGGLLWAPEFHIIKDRLYIFHAATREPFFEEESHVMELKEGGNPCNKDDWSRPRRIVRPDGSDICEAGKEITLDMTEFEFDESFYVIWSQRQFLPKDLGAWLYIAKLNPDKPWMLASDPVVLSKPDYGWGNNHTFVEEGPFALFNGDKLHITFSGAAVDTSYVVGLLSIEHGKNPLEVTNWIKKGYPILTSRSVPGEFGTGHNAFVTDEDGVVWNTYHARPGTEGPRSSGIRRVHFNFLDEPVLDMTEDLDISDEFKEISVNIVVQ